MLAPTLARTGQLQEAQAEMAAALHLGAYAISGARRLVAFKYSREIAVLQASERFACHCSLINSRELQGLPLWAVVLAVHSAAMIATGRTLAWSVYHSMRLGRSASSWRVLNGLHTVGGARLTLPSPELTR